MSPINFIVIDENTFCYVDERQPRLACILASKPQKGAIYSWTDGTMPMPMTLDGTNYGPDVSRIRPARRSDFEDYRICEGSYNGAPERYAFPEA